MSYFFSAKSVQLRQTLCLALAGCLSLFPNTVTLAQEGTVDCPASSVVAISGAYSASVLHWDNDTEGPRVQIQQYSNSSDCPSCFKISYNGPLYSACGGSCRITQYSYLLDKKGVLQKFCVQKGTRTLRDGTVIPLTETSLSRFDTSSEDLHSLLSLEELERIKDMANDRTLLDFVDQRRSLTHDYVASISKTYFMHDAGNTVGTFIVHLNKARAQLFKDQQLDDCELVLQQILSPQRAAEDAAMMSMEKPAEPDEL